MGKIRIRLLTPKAVEVYNKTKDHKPNFRERQIEMVLRETVITTEPLTIEYTLIHLNSSTLLTNIYSTLLTNIYSTTCLALNKSGLERNVDYTIEVLE